MIEITFCVDCKKGTRAKPTVCQCGKPMLQIVIEDEDLSCFRCDISSLTTAKFARELIEMPIKQSSFELPGGVYDFHFDCSFKGIDLVLHTETGFITCEGFTLSVSGDSEAFKPCKISQMPMQRYQEIFTAEKETRFCPRVSKNSKPFRMKVVSELSSQTKFVWPSNLRTIYFDIETMMLDGDYRTVPKSEFARNRAQIGLISQVTQIGDHMEYVIYARDRYYANIPALRENLGLQDIIIKLYTSETAMCNDFLKQFTDSTPTILTGFNASSRLSFGSIGQQLSNWDKEVIHGYDLDWVVRRSTIKLTPINGVYKVSAELKYKITKGFKELPNLYVVDSQLLFAQQLKPDDLKDMTSRDLNGYLQTFGLTEKKGHNYYTMQERLANANTDLTDIFEYSLYDSIALWDVFESRNILTKIQAEMELWNVPLSFALYETANTKNQIMITRGLLRKSLLPPYTVDPQTEESSSEKIKGAYTYTNEEDMLKVHHDVLCFDFNSLYPSCIIAFNLSADTLCENPQQEFGDDWIKYVHDIDCTDDQTIQKHLYFYKESVRAGVLPETCREFLNKRKEIKEQMRKLQHDQRSSQYRALDNQQLAVKLGNNAIFGGTASAFNPLYKREVSAATTACARKAIHTLNHIIDTSFPMIPGRTTRIIANDTDSAFMLAGDLLEAQVEARDSTYNHIQSVINFALLKAFGPMLKVEAEEVIKRFCPSKAKKSYFRHEQSLTDFFKGRDQKYKLVAKGVQWSRLDQFNRSLIRKFFDMYLLKGQRETLQELLQHHIEEYNGMVRAAIQSHDLSELKKFAIRLRSSSKIGHEVIQNHQHLDIKDDYIFAVKLAGTTKQTSMVPIQALTNTTFEQIDFNHLTRNYKSQLDKFFNAGETKSQGKLKTQFNDVKEMLQDDQMLVRIESVKTHVGVIRDLVPMTPSEAFQLGQSNPKLSIHEVLHSPYIKLFFDVDGDQELGLFEFREALNRTLFNNAITHYCELFIATCHRGSKKSYHIVSNLVIHKTMCKIIAVEMKERFPAIDLAVYDLSELRSLRFIGCSKIKPDGTIDKTPFQTTATPDQMSITVNADCQIERLSPCFDQQPIFKFENATESRDAKQVQCAIQKGYPNLAVSQQQNHLYILYIQPDTDCPVCKKPHSTAGKIYAVVSNKAVTIKCFKATNQNQTPVRVPFEDEQAKVTINPAVCYRGDFIETQNSRFVQFDFNAENEILAVRSPLGCGKTEQTIRLIKKMTNPSVLVLSIRHTLSQDMAKRYQQTGLPVRVYDDLKGRLSIAAEVLICQVESIQRLVDQTYDLLVLDEFQSIMEQLSSGLVKDPQALYTRFVKLIDQSKRVLILDGQLQKSSISTFEYIAQRPIRVVYNAFKPYAGHTFRIHKLRTVDDLDQAVQLIQTDLTAGKNVYSHCNSRKRVLAIESHMKSLQFKTRVYHGANLMQEEGGVNHGLLKKQHFADVQNHWKSFQFLAYSSAVSAGIDFSLDHFYRGVHIFVPNSSSPMSFTQAIFRTRKLEHNVHDLFIAERDQFHVNTNAQHYEYIRKMNQGTHILLPCASRSFALEIAVEAYKLAMQSNRTNIIIANLKDLGCDIQLVEEPTITNTLTKSLLEELPPANLTSQYLANCTIKRSALKYFLAKPHQRQEMINQNEIEANCEFDIQAIAITISLAKLTDIADNEESLNTIQNTLDTLRQDNPAAKLIDIYIRNKSYQPFKKAFGRLYDHPINWVTEHVNTTIKQQAELIKLGQTMKGVTLTELIKMGDQSIKARQWVEIADEEERETKAKEWFKYGKNRYYLIYGILGQDYEAIYKRTRSDGKQVRALEQSIIKPLPLY